MVTHEAMNTLFQFGTLIVTMFIAVVAIIALVINKKK
ncbi:putative holin-like toxin [Halalkalibacter alkalisediminis]|uniref:Holin-like toxin n=1 Tax=Halalkalibacter alkalisediminis TaxID=935616 RepID=A0ABV6NJA7_9BACI|nr:putative holin-like toxin [Halalkalibacter alkalisediminis]